MHNSRPDVDFNILRRLVDEHHYTLTWGAPGFLVKTIVHLTRPHIPRRGDHEAIHAYNLLFAKPVRNLIGPCAGFHHFTQLALSVFGDEFPESVPGIRGL